MLSSKFTAYRAIKFCLLTLSIVFLVDFSSFLFVCRSFSKKTELLPEQVIQPTEQEVTLVVLTGDRKRIPKALELLNLHRRSTLIISGAGRGATLTELFNIQGSSTENIQAIWSKIILESLSTSTIENARESEKTLNRIHAERVILITSEYHMARSLAIFRVLAPGHEYTAYPVASEFTELLDLHPSQFLEGSWKVFLEYWKFFLFKNYYLRIRGGE